MIVSENAEIAPLLRTCYAEKHSCVRKIRKLGCCWRSSALLSPAIVALRENRLPQLHPAQIVPPRKVIREAQMLLLQSEDSILLVRDETSGQIIALLTLHDLLRAQEGFVAKKG